MNQKSVLIGIFASIMMAASCTNAPQASINVIPMPAEVTVHHGSFDMAGAEFVLDESIDSESASYIASFKQLLDKVSEGKVSKNRVEFSCDSTLAAEEYTIEVQGNKTEVKAASLNGFVYAIQTIKQLLPVAIFSDSPAADTKWTIPAVSIKDSPRFSYRGMHLDCSRHFFEIDEVKRYIDFLEMHKMNRFHWHLTEDQGWRIEIKKYPRLTEVGAWREGTQIGKDFYSNDGIRYGGYYTQEQLREVVEYAAQRGITVIPEIDLPGHMLAAITAYPELGCTGGPYKVWTRWGISNDVLCAGNEKIYKFLDDVFDELIEIFPSEYIHIGGDECPKTRWAACPKCQAKIKALGYKSDDHFKAEDYLQTYVMNRVEKHLNSKGRKVIGWDEVLDGDLSQSATIMSWRGTIGGIKAARSGRDAIMTPNGFMYFDYYQSRVHANEPLCIGGYLPVDKVYSYEPFDESMTEDECSHILGVQANLWTEYIATKEHLQYMYLPRIDALSEVQWCQKENKNWERFRASLQTMRERYDLLGVTYATHVFDGRLDAEKETTRPLKHKAVGKEATLLTKPHASYHYKAPLEFFDGVSGYNEFASGAWIGFYSEPMSVVVDMEGKSYRRVTLDYLSGKPDFIFAPTWIKVYTSEDGQEFTLAAEAEYEVEGKDSPDCPKQATLDLGKKTKARYLKVEAGTTSELPSWHPGAGQQAFLFVGEIMVN